MIAAGKHASLLRCQGINYVTIKFYNVEDWQNYGLRGLPGDSTMKLFTAVRYEFLNMLVFAPDKPYQPSLMFAGKAGAYPNKEPFRCRNSRVGSWPSQKE
jgi:hypothetical protein